MISEVYNIDCLEYMKGLPDKFFELAIVDPPYGIKGDRSFQTVKNRIDKRNGRPIVTKKQNVGKWDNARPENEYFIELRRVTKSQIIWGANYFTDLLPCSSGWIVWDKCNGNSDQSDCELAWTSFKTACRQIEYMWTGLLQGKSILEGRVNQGDKRLCEKRIHPTQKPVALYKWLLQNYAKKGDKIFDSHMGSQSSRLAAWDMGFDYYGCELDAEYFEQGNKRFEDFKKQQSLFTPEQAEVKTGLGYDLFASDNLKLNKHLK